MSDGKKYLDLQADFNASEYQMFYNAMAAELNVPINHRAMQLLDYNSFSMKSS